jgi:hypothetical protein
MRKILQYVLPVTITLFMCVTVERTVVTDGGYDRLWGLPLPYISNDAGFVAFADIAYDQPILNSYQLN